MISASTVDRIRHTRGPSPMIRCRFARAWVTLGRKLTTPRTNLMGAAFATFLSVALPGDGSADRYLPLTVGNWWEYRGSYIGEHEVQRVERSANIAGHEVRCIVFRESTHNEGLEQYWTETPDGGAQLWGWVLTDGYGILYQPPIEMIQPPLWLGKIWRQNCGTYTLPDTTLIGFFDFDCEVYEDFNLVVPAGSFHVFGVGFTESEAPVFASRDLAGLWSDGHRGSDVWAWWTDGVGRAQYSTSDMYQLVAYFQQPTPTRTTTWGRIKAVFSRGSSDGDATWAPPMRGAERP